MRGSGNSSHQGFWKLLLMGRLMGTLWDLMAAALPGSSGAAVPLNLPTKMDFLHLYWGSIFLTMILSKGPIRGSSFCYG